MPKLEEVIGSFWKSTFVEFNCNFIAKTYAEIFSFDDKDEKLLRDYIIENIIESKEDDDLPRRYGRFARKWIRKNKPGVNVYYVLKKRMA